MELKEVLWGSWEWDWETGGVWARFPDGVGAGTVGRMSGQTGLWTNTDHRLPAAAGGLHSPSHHFICSAIFKECLLVPVTFQINHTFGGTAGKSPKALSLGDHRLRGLSRLAQGPFVSSVIRANDSRFLDLYLIGGDSDWTSSWG